MSSYIVMFALLVLTALAVCLGSAVCAPLSDKVEIGFYSEALCGDCIAVSKGPLTDALNELGDIIILKYVPWGNAKIGWFGKFECQHGEIECVMNTVSACAMHYYPNQTVYWPFVHCLDGHGDFQDLKIAEKCANKTNLNWDNINSCQSGELGKKLERGYADETAQLSPPHTYTPWVTINGKHTPQAENLDNGLIKAVCEAYTGDKTFPACN